MAFCGMRVTHTASARPSRARRAAYPWSRVRIRRPSSNANASADRGGVELAAIDEEGLIAVRYDGASGATVVWFDPGLLRPSSKRPDVAPRRTKTGVARTRRGRQLSPAVALMTADALASAIHWIGARGPALPGLPLRRSLNPNGLCRVRHARLQERAATAAAPIHATTASSRARAEKA